MGTYRQCERATYQCCSIPVTSTAPNVLIALGLRPPDRSLSEMSASLDVDRKTLRKYIAPAAAAGIAPGGRAKSREEWAELVRGWFQN
jgi:hypothetical protein